MVGLVVTPTMLYSSTSDCRLPLRMRSRERSSSQTATPAFDSCATFSFWAISCPPLGGCSAAPLEGAAVSVQVVGGQRGPSSAVAGRVLESAHGHTRAGGRHVGRTGGPQALAGGRRDGVGGQPELLVQR